MTQKLHVFSEISGAGRVGLSPEWAVTDGNPVATTHPQYLSEDRTMLSGVWESTPGTYRVEYVNWEYCNILTGRCTITPDDGDPIDLAPGSIFVVEPGFTGIWKVHEHMSKNFVFRLKSPLPA